jgi:hypothetical protein
MLDRFARVGTLGILGEPLNALFNPDTSRPFSLDSRLVIANSLNNFIKAGAAFYQQDFTATYATVWRQLIGAMGGAGWLQNAEVVNNLVAPVFGNEARYTARINVNNNLRVAGRQIGLDVRSGWSSQTVSTPIRPWVTEMILQALANDPTGFNQAYQKAITAAMQHRGESRVEAEKYIAGAYRSYSPLQAVFKTAPNQSDYMRILASLGDSGRSAVSDAVRLTDAYGAKIGATPGFRQESRGGKQPNLPAALRMRSLTSERLFGGF